MTDAKTELADGLTVIVAALNEQDNIARVVGDILAAARRRLAAFEVIIVDDGSTDGTGAIADRLAEENPEVRVVHNSGPTGVGGVLKTGLVHTRTRHVTAFPGDGAVMAKSFDPFFEAFSETPLIISYRENQFASRSRLRFVLSRVYNLFMNLAFGIRVRDVHSSTVYPTEAIRGFDFDVYGGAYHPALLAELIRREPHYKQIPIWLDPKSANKSGTLRWAILMQALRTFFKAVTDRLRGAK